MFPTLSCLYVDELKYTGNVPPRVLGLFNGDNSSRLNYITIIRVTSSRPVMHLYFAIHRRFLPVLDQKFMLLLTVEMYCSPKKKKKKKSILNEPFTIWSPQWSDTEMFNCKKTSVLGLVPNATHSYHSVYSRPSQAISFSNYYYQIFTKVWTLNLFNQY